MNAEELFGYLKGWIEKISHQVNFSMQGMGYSIPIPQEATEEAKTFVDHRLRGLFWTFERCHIGSKEYYVLFPLP